MDRASQVFRHSRLGGVSDGFAGPHGLALLPFPAELGQHGYGAPAQRYVSAAEPVLRLTALALVVGNRAPADDLMVACGGSVSAMVATGEDLFDAVRTLWDDDEISEPDVRFGLGVLLRAYRDAQRRRPWSWGATNTARILVASAPGDPHFVQASMAGDILVKAGLAVERAIDESAVTLLDMARDREIGGVVICSSPVFSRETMADELDGLVDGLNTARPDVPVVSLGRLAMSEPDVLDGIGFDVYCRSALELPTLFSGHGGPAAWHTPPRDFRLAS